jgi:acetyl-CoA carboxylase biotin carboxylase subunit
MSPLSKPQDKRKRGSQKIGYPVIIKAAAGGGGKGMRICHNDIKLASSFMTAQAEAEVNFGNPNVYIERYIDKTGKIIITPVLGGNKDYLLWLDKQI